MRWAAGLGLAASGALAVGSQVAGASVAGTGTGTVVNDITSGSTASFTGKAGMPTGTITVGSFADTDGSNAFEFVVTVNWGDGTSSAGTVTCYQKPYYTPLTQVERTNTTCGKATVSGTHTYTAAGTFPVTLTVIDTTTLGFGCGSPGVTTRPVG